MVGKDEEVEGRLLVPAPTTLLPDIELSILITMFNKKNGVKFNLGVLFSKSNVKNDRKISIKSFVPKCGKVSIPKVVFAPKDFSEGWRAAKCDVKIEFWKRWLK